MFPPHLPVLIIGLLIAGTVVVVIIIILLIIDLSKRRRVLASISQSNLNNLFACPKCGTIATIYLIKVVRDYILVKQRCPIHGIGHSLIPTRLKDDSMPYFRDAIFRCFKCGQKANLFHEKYSGPWALISVDCPTHGIKTYRIWHSVYEEITKGKTDN
ncbi:MAG: hypothetical protein ACFFBH_05585 [Promethearchaeota archaeon]